MKSRTDTGIRLVVGLGNIGNEYERTRHNAGFWFVDALAARLGARLSNESKFFGEAGRCAVDGTTLWLLKPGTYMNLSGKSVAALARFYQIGPESVLIAHDELDLAPGAIRLKQGGGAAGHNGLKDIGSKFGQNTWRLRIGIGHPRTLGLAQDPGDFVLARPRSEELSAIEAALPAALEVMSLLAEGHFERAVQSLHRAAKGPAPGKAPSEAAPR